MTRAGPSFGGLTVKQSAYSRRYLMINQLLNKCLKTTVLSRQTSATYNKNILQSLPPFVTSLKYTELYIVAFIIPFWKVFCMIGQKEKNKKDSQKTVFIRLSSKINF